MQRLCCFITRVCVVCLHCRCYVLAALSSGSQGSGTSDVMISSLSSLLFEIELNDTTTAAAIVRAIIIVALILVSQPNKQYPEPCPLAGSLSDCTQASMTRGLVESVVVEQ